MLRLSFNAHKGVGGTNIYLESILLYWLTFSVLLTIVAVYYLFLLSNGTFQLFAPELLDKAFDNMLVHLLRGDFTVDRDAIGPEAFTRDGKTYAYFGIFPAILRIFAMPFTDIAQVELARLSCLTALVIFVALQLRMLLIVHHGLPPESRKSELLAVMVIATVLSGPQLYILNCAWIYNEPILWSAAMAAAFNLVIVRTTFGTKSLGGRELVLLAASAGLAINTRASVGGALYLGAILLIAWTVWRRHRSDRLAPQSSEKPMRLSSTILPPIAILGLAAAGAAVVNFERWGNPFTFADFRYWDMRVNVYSNTIEILRKYGEFNVGRIWIGALYYATDIPYLLHNLPPFAEFLRARVALMSSPPVTPVLTNPLTIILAGIGLYCVWWRPKLRRRDLGILRLTLLAHASSVILILGYWFLTLRYRFDFAPFMTLAALIGYGSVSEARAFCRKRVSIAATGLCFLGILSSHYELILNKVYAGDVPMHVRLTLLPFAPFAHYTFH
jgi:hypothetical protein